MRRAYDAFPVLWVDAWAEDTLSEQKLRAFHEAHKHVWARGPRQRMLARMTNQFWWRSLVSGVDL